MSLIIRTAFVALLIVATLSAAFAQYEDDKPSKFGIRLMNFVPMDSALSDVGSTWTGAGFDYYLDLDEDERPTKIVTFGLMSAENRNVKLSNYPITYTRLRRFPISESRSKYNGYGGGIYRLGFKVSGAGDTAYRPGVHVLYGQELRDTYFAEIRADYVPKWDNNNWGGIFINIGTRVSL